MIPYNPNRLFVPLPNTFVNRLPPGVDNADPTMVAPPVTDPGYALPNVDISSLVQGPAGVNRAYPASAQQPQTGRSGATGWTFDPAQAQAALDAMKRT